MNEEVISVNTNRIEGAWKHAKSHFRKINGTSLPNFEAHLTAHVEFEAMPSALRLTSSNAIIH